MNARRQDYSHLSFESHRCCALINEGGRRRRCEGTANRTGLCPSHRKHAWHIFDAQQACAVLAAFFELLLWEGK